MAKYFRSYGTTFKKYLNHLSKKTLKIQESCFGNSAKFNQVTVLKEVSKIIGNSFLISGNEK